MGSRGPLPLPKNVRELHGAKPSDIHASPPRPVLGVPTMPSWLEPEAKAEWRRIVPELVRLGLLSKLDRARLSSYCQTWAIYVRAAKAVADAPLAVPGDRGREMKKAPEWMTYQQAMTLMESALKALGLTPADRLRMKAPDVEDEDDGVLG